MTQIRINKREYFFSIWLNSDNNMITSFFHKTFIKRKKYYLFGRLIDDTKLKLCFNLNIDIAESITDPIFLNILEAKEIEYNKSISK